MGGRGSEGRPGPARSPTCPFGWVTVHGLLTEGQAGAHSLGGVRAAGGWLPGGAQPCPGTPLGGGLPGPRAGRSDKCICVKLGTFLVQAGRGLLSKMGVGWACM